MSPGTSVSNAAAGSAAGEAQLAHMRHVEEAGPRAGVQMLGEDAGRVVHRHLIAGKRHHAGAERPMERVKRRALQRYRILGGHNDASDRERTRLRPLCPLCRGP